MKIKKPLVWIFVLVISLSLLVWSSLSGCKPTPSEHAVIAEAGGNKITDLGEEITFDASESTVSPISEETLITYSWDWDGDGQYDETSEEAVITHIYEKAGTYEVTLKVTAFDGVSTTDTLAITVNDVNKNPIADPGGPYTATVGEKLTFDGSASSDSDGKITKYIWDFGDGSTGSGVSPTHTYTEAGEYKVTLNVKDDNDSLSTKAITTATIEPAKEVLTTPTIKLEIYEGPTYAEAGGICYYRVEAVVTGNPTPTVEFSRDDSLGAWGSKKVQVNLYNPNETYTLSATAINSEGEAKGNIILRWGCEEEVGVSLWGDVNSLLRGPAGNPTFRSPTTNFMGGIQDSDAAQVMIELPGGETIILPIGGIAFEWEPSFLGEIQGMPLAGGTYTFTALDAKGAPIPGEVTSDVYIGGYEVNPPSNIHAEIVETGILITWDVLPVIPGAFDPSGSPSIGHYHIPINRETGEKLYSWSGSETSHLIPFSRQDLGPHDVGLALEDMGDGIYNLGVHAASYAPKGTAGYGIECQAFDPAGIIRFVIEGGQIRIEMQ